MSRSSTVALAVSRLLVPPLTSTAYKGQAGKVAVFGGCAEYTGAPFYAALAALKVGADLSHVFCDDAAAVPIKSYSPELIVHGCLQSGDETDVQRITEQADEVSKWFPALTALVVGPGLGRDAALQAVARLVVERAVAASMPCVLDADGLRLVLEHPKLVAGAEWVVLTPNKPEFGRLVAAFLPDADCSDEGEMTAQLSRALGGVTIVRKGPIDLISDGESTVLCEEEGSLKRSGGQGDVLAGTAATLLSWAKARQAVLPKEAPPAPIVAAATACMLTRRCSKYAFAKHRRAMTAPDVIDAIGEVFEEFSPAASGADDA